MARHPIFLFYSFIYCPVWRYGSDKTVTTVCIVFKRLHHRVWVIGPDNCPY